MLTKVDIIKEKLLDDITSGKLIKDEAIPSRHQFMKRYQCARGTIDQAINELTQEGFLYSRQGAGTYVADKPGQIKVNQVFIIGGTGHFSETDFSNRNSLGLAEDFQDQLPCYLFNSKDMNVNMGKIAKRGSAVIWSTPPYEQLKTMKYLEKLSIPQVLVNRLYSNMNYITTDTKPGILEGLKWLVDKTGKDSFAFISQAINSDRPYLAERQIAFYESAVELGIKLSPDYIFTAPFNNTAKDINHIGDCLFKSGNCPKAIFLTEIQASLPFLSYASACGKEAGKDFHLLIFDQQKDIQNTPGVGMLMQRWDLMRLESIKWVHSIRKGGSSTISKRIPPKLIISNE